MTPDLDYGSSTIISRKNPQFFPMLTPEELVGLLDSNP